MGKGSGSGKGALLLESRLSSSDVSSVTPFTPTPIKQGRVVPQPPSKPAIKPKGLQNVGNTCYANAALQCLMSTALTHALLNPESVVVFRRYSSNPNMLEIGCTGSVTGDEDEEDDIDRLSREQRREVKRKQKMRRKMHQTCRWLTRELTAITRQYTADLPPVAENSILGGFLGVTEDAVVNPGSITKHPDRLSTTLHPYQQEDAHEFMRALLSALTRNGHNKKLSSLFDGLLESVVTCQECGNMSITRDRYMDLSLDISHPGLNTLNDALGAFTHTEVLDCDNKVMCAMCQRKQVVTKGLRLATAPSVLACHLKRFAYDRYGRLIRLSKHINFPLKLEIGAHMSKMNRAKPPPYELVSVLVHQGRSCESGHYMAYVKSGKDWYKANDSVITKVDVESVLRQPAYILMYEVAGMRERHGYTHLKEDLPPTPRFRGSVAPDQDSVCSTLLSLVCSASEVNDAIIRDFCCGATPENVAVVHERPPRRQPSTPATRRARQTRFTFRDDGTVSDDTIGNFSVGDSTIGESTLSCDSRRTTESSDTRTTLSSSLKRSSSSSNLREFEYQASRAYRENPQRLRNFKDEGTQKKRSQSAQPPRQPQQQPPLPPKPSYKRRHTTTIVAD